MSNIDPRAKVGDLIEIAPWTSPESEWDFDGAWTNDEKVSAQCAVGLVTKIFDIGIQKELRQTSFGFANITRMAVIFTGKSQDPIGSDNFVHDNRELQHYKVISRA